MIINVLMSFGILWTSKLLFKIPQYFGGFLWFLVHFYTVL